MPNTLTIEPSGFATTVTLCRPEVHNALNAALIRELKEAFAELSRTPDVRVIILAGEGKSFCAGGDLNWMRQSVGLTEAENLADALALAAMFRTLRECPRPVIARVHGHAFGGGAGLTAACDLAAAVDSAQFCFSEVKLGLVPAVISPFVLERIGAAARRYFLTAERFAAAEAKRIGLVDEVAGSPEELDRVIARWVDHVLANGPEALAAAKRLMGEVAGPDLDRVLPLAAERIASQRVSEEGQEGVRAFLEKRPPRWAGEPPDVP